MPPTNRSLLRPTTAATPPRGAIRSPHRMPLPNTYRQIISPTEAAVTIRRPREMNRLRCRERNSRHRIYTGPAPARPPPQGAPPCHPRTRITTLAPALTVTTRWLLPRCSIAMARKRREDTSRHLHRTGQVGRRQQNNERLSAEARPAVARTLQGRPDGPADPPQTVIAREMAI